MISLKNIKYKLTYNKAIDNIADDFYIPSMLNSTIYNRISGYFSSTIYIIAWSALKEFVRHGGRMYIICSPCLTEEDQQAITLGESAKKSEIIKNQFYKEINNLFLENTLSSPNKVLACLIGLDIIQIKIAVGESDADPYVDRLFHDKAGIFCDGINMVGFRGSINETYKGLSNDGNIESIDVYTNWSSETDIERVNINKDFFDDLWNDMVPNVNVYSFPDALKTEVKNKTKKIDWLNLIDEVKVTTSNSLKWAADKSNGGLRPKQHQITALENWKLNGYSGILEHATGSGKTYTAICAISYALNRCMSILVLVPSIDLVGQWQKELVKNLHDEKIHYLLCCSGHNEWKKNNALSSWTAHSSNNKRITIATLDTAVSKEFMNKIICGKHLFIVADEVHRTGSLMHRELFHIDAGYKLGLSATPKRYGDPIGTQSIIDYFGKIIQPPFTLKDAIDNDVLTPYFYYPKIVYLNENEQLKWDHLTSYINKNFAIIKSKSNCNSLIISDSKLKLLLIKRARILKSANGKISLAKSIIENNYKPGQKWIIYCDDIKQLNSVTNILSKNTELPLYKYYSEMPGDRKKTLDHFSLYGGIIVSIKCLDEGVDIPSTTHALILASSKNPREFIQRRGRILRKAEGKNYSYLFDSIVLPNNMSNSSDDKTSIIVKSELSRSIQFGEWSVDKSCVTLLKDIAIKYNINYKEISEGGYEEQDE